MGKLGKWLVGCTLVGVTAAGVYYYLEQAAKMAEEEGMERVPGAEIQGFGENASRTYTTIKESAGQAMAKMKEKMGPRGEGVLNVAQETAGKMKNVLEDTARELKDVWEETAPHASEEETWSFPTRADAERAEEVAEELEEEVKDRAAEAEDLAAETAEGSTVETIFDDTDKV